MCLYVRAGAQGPHTRACDVNRTYYGGLRYVEGRYIEVRSALRSSTMISYKGGDWRIPVHR